MKYVMMFIGFVFFLGCSSCNTCAHYPHITFTPNERALLDKILLAPSDIPNNYALSHQIKEPYIRSFMSENPGNVDIKAFALAHPDHPLSTLKLWHEALFFSPYDTLSYSVLLWPDSQAAIHYLDTLQEPQNGMKKIYRIGAMLLIFDVRNNHNQPLSYDPSHPIIAWMHERIHKLSE